MGERRGPLRREALIWLCFFRALTRRPKPDGFPYGRGLRSTFTMVLVLLLVEGAVVEGILALVLGDSVWVWIGLALHLYAIGWIVGVIASVEHYPHVLDDGVLRLRDGVFAEVAIPLDDIAGVREAKRSNLGRSGLKVVGDTALMAYGDATVRIDLRRGAVTGIAVSADDPGAFVEAVRSAG